jgi:hypothetical protein
MLTAIDIDTSGLPGAMPSTASRISANPASDAITAPNPTCEAVFISGMIEALAPSSSTDVNPMPSDPARRCAICTTARPAARSRRPVRR